MCWRSWGLGSFRTLPCCSYPLNCAFSMYNIVLLKSPGNLNVGNEFINVGAEYLVKRALDRAGVKEYKLSCSEFWETTLSLYKFRTSWNTKEMQTWINDADLILVAGVAIVNKYMEGFLRDVGGMKPPKILLGAGMLAYDEQERKIAKEALSKYDFVMCRDNLLHEVIKDTVSSHSGIDLAFYLNDVFSLSGAKGKYAVVNMNLNLRQMWQLRRKYVELKKKFSTIYVTENTSTTHKNIKSFTFLSRWS